MAGRLSTAVKGTACNIARSSVDPDVGLDVIAVTIDEVVGDLVRGVLGLPDRIQRQIAGGRPRGTVGIGRARAVILGVPSLETVSSAGWRHGNADGYGGVKDNGLG